MPNEASLVRQPVQGGGGREDGLKLATAFAQTPVAECREVGLGGGGGGDGGAGGPGLVAYEASKPTCRVCQLELRILDLLFGVGGGVRGMMTALLRRHSITISPEETFYSVFAVLS